MSFYSKVVLPGDGTVGPFIFDKGYLNKSHVKCYLNGNSVGFSFITGSTINLDVATEIGDTLVIKRETPKLDPIVDFKNGAYLMEQNLDEATLQVLFVTQEAVDELEGSLTSNLSGNFDALNNKLVNLAPGTETGDAVTYEQVVGILDDIQALADQVAQDADDAEASAQNAAQFDFENHDHSIADVTGLQDALDDKASITSLDDKADLSDLTGNTVPIGAIIDFPVDAVPLGFLPCLGATFDELVYPELYTYLGTNVLPDYGDRVRRGKGTLAGNVGDTQEDAFQGHWHSHVKGWASSSWNPGTCNSSDRLYTGTNNDCGVGDGSVIDAVSDGVNGTPRTASETRVKSGIILPCIKAYSSFTSQGTADLAAMEQAINSAVLASGVQVFGDGGAQVRANIGADVNLGELHIQDQKPQGSSGGTFTSGPDITRDLNTVLKNTITGASLLANQFTLPAGTYYLDAICQAYGVDRHQALLFNVTDGAAVLLGKSGYASSTGNSIDHSFIRGDFTITGSKTFEVRHNCQTTYLTYGFGVESNQSTEVYTDIILKKVA